MSYRKLLPLRALVPLLVLVCWPGVALAQNSVTGDSAVAHATFTNVGVTVTITGDDNGNASAALEVNVAGGGFQPAHRLSRVASDRFVGSAFYLPASTGFEVRVTLTDPDGVTNGTLTASGTTREDTVPQSTGATVHVANGGDDGGAGTALDPYETIARGLLAAQPGDTVLVHAGTYHEQVDVTQGGAPGAPITLAAAGDGPAVMDGAEPDLKDPAAWTDEGGSVYSAAVAQTRYVSVDGVRLWRYETLGDLQSLAFATDGGFFFDGATVFVRLPGDAAPAGHELQVSTLGRALWIEGAPHVVIDGLTIRCYGGEEYSEGIMVRDGSHGVWIVNTTFESVMPGIWVKNDVDDLTIRGNTFSDRGLAEFPWYEVKAQGGMESGAVAVDTQYDGQGIVFEGNVVHDSFDGLNICGDTAMSTPNNADVVGNLIFHLGDDGIETDGTCSNIRILGNRFEDALVGVSVAPAVVGPTYVIRNLMVDLKNVSPDTDWSVRAMKFNVGDSRPSGDIFAYHNTGVTYEADQAAFTVTDDSRWSELHLANNLWVGTDFAFEFTNTDDEPFFHDYDLFHSTGTRLVRYQGTAHDTPAAYFGATGLCEHCVAGNPLFTDGLGGDYTLTAQSPAVDQAILIPGVNDSFEGGGPDIGALEYGAIVPPLPDAGVLPDSGPRPDAAPGSDAGASGDGGTGNGDGDDSGCSCSTRRGAPGRGAPMGWISAAILLLCWIRRRR
ncbi:MAG: right-handed parallel beta-helix repeat-containing protein [bacterium]